MPHITHVNNILHSTFSNAELYINNHQIYNSNGLYAHESHISNNFKNTLSDYKEVLHCEGYDYEEDPENLAEGPCFTGRMKLYSRPDGFMLYGKLGIDFLTTSELLYPNKIQTFQISSVFNWIQHLSKLENLESFFALSLTLKKSRWSLNYTKTTWNRYCVVSGVHLM